MGTLGALQNIRGAVERPSLGSLKTAQEVAGQVRLSVARVRELAEAMLIPHVRIDGGEPLFCVHSLKRYVRANMTEMFHGAPLPLDLRPIFLTPNTQALPLVLASIQDRLCDCQAVDIPPCVYFLIEAGAVVYVGQSRNLAARLLQHRQDGKQWDRAVYLPVLGSELFRIEAHWIAALQPPLNRTIGPKPQEKGR